MSDPLNHASRNLAADAFASLIDRVRVLGRQATRALEKGRIGGLGAS